MATVTLPPQTIPDEDVEPDYLFEIVDGQYVEKPSMSARDDSIASQLLYELIAFDPKRQLGRVLSETLFVLDRDKKRKRRPDLAFVTRKRWPPEKHPAFTTGWDVVPDLAIEIISPTNKSNDDMDKLDEYFQAGVRLVWYVYPRHRRICIYTSTTQSRIVQVGDELEGGDVLPGFRLPLAVLFEDAPTTANGA